MTALPWWERLNTLAAELANERHQREAAVKQLGDVLAEQLELEVQAIHTRIDEVHERALRELTRLHGGGTPE